MSDAKLEVARRSFQAWSDRDAVWFVENTTPEFEFVAAVMTTVEGGSGAVRDGEKGIRQYFTILDEPWESFVVDEMEYREVDDQVVCVGRLRAKGRGSGVEFDQPIAMVLWFDGDKIARARSFLDVDEAMAAAKVALPETIE
jgi:ketosteroid isomerase-like protein